MLGTRLTLHVDSTDAVIRIIESNVIGSRAGAYFGVVIRISYITIYHQPWIFSLFQFLGNSFSYNALQNLRCRTPSIDAANQSVTS